MRALHYNAFGRKDNLVLGDLPDPAPGPGQLLVRVGACALNPKDVMVRKGKFKVLMWGHTFPHVTGSDWAGQVEAVGSGVRDFAVGDSVWGMIDDFTEGACAELLVVDESRAARRPDSLSVTDAVSIPLAAQTALQGLADILKVGPGDRVLLNGASGGVGLYAIQITKLLGAEAVAVCSSRNEDLVREWGADEVLAYDKVDILASGRAWHAFFDIFGNYPFPTVRRHIHGGKRYTTAVPTGDAIRREFFARLRGKKHLVHVQNRRKDLDRLRAWVDAGQLKPAIDRVLPVTDFLDAYAHLETRRARGKIVLDLRSE